MYSPEPGNRAELPNQRCLCRKTWIYARLYAVKFNFSYFWDNDDAYYKNPAAGCSTPNQKLEVCQRDIQQANRKPLPHQQKREWHTSACGDNKSAKQF